MATENAAEPEGEMHDTIEYQLGQAETSGEGVDLGEESEFLPWDLEVKTAIKRLAIDIYSSKQAGVRETETNSSAAIIKAVEEGFLTSLMDGIIKFILKERTDGSDDPDAQELELTIRDNGTGMTEATVRKVLRVLGRSLTRDDGNRSGAFGMGFAASFLLTGWDAAFELHTHSREDGEEPISAVINNEGITIDHEGVLPDGFDNDEYGTKLKFVLNDDISRDDIRKWVRKNAQFARVPVEYSEIDTDGDVSYEKDYGMKKLEADYDATAPTIVYEDEFIRAVLSPEADGRTILLDAPIKRGYTRNGDLPWSFDIRLKNENGPIVKSDDPERIGLYKTDEGDYKSMSPDRQEKYTTEVRPNEVAMASVAGTRDTLKRDATFWTEYVIPKLYDAYTQEVQRVLGGLDDPADVTDLSRTDLVLVKQAVSDRIDDWVGGTFSSNNRSKDEYTADQLIDDIRSEFDVELDDDIARLLVALKRDVWVVSPDHAVDNQPDDEYMLPDDCGEREAWEVAESDAGRVFMGVSINQKKADVVWEDSDDNHVVELDSADDYDVFEQALGWERLASVTRSTIDEFDISGDLREEFTSKVGTKQATSTDQKQITLTYRKLANGRRRWQKEWKLQRENATAQTLRSDFKDLDWHGERPSYGARRSSRARPRLLVLFPDGDEENISDYYWLASRDLALAKVSDDVADYLTDGVDSILTFTEYEQKAESYRVTTSEGRWTTSISTDNIVFHLLDEDVIERFRQPEVLDGMPETLREMQEDDALNWPRDLSTGEVIYAPITREDLLYARYHLKEGSDAMLLTGDKTFKPANDRTKNLNSDTQMYARSALLGLDNAPDDVREFFSEVEASLDNGGLTVVNALVDHYSDP